MTNTTELKHLFWTSLADSPFLFLQLDADPHTAVPMTAQLDKEANHAIWFFTKKDHVFAAGGPATATYADKGHQMFARFSGHLVHELSGERIDALYDNTVAAWYDRGKQDPSLLLLRMNLTGEAEIWNSDLGFLDNTKMLLGFDVQEEAKKEHTETTL